MDVTVQLCPIQTPILLAINEFKFTSVNPLKSDLLQDISDLRNNVSILNANHDL